MNPFQSIGKLLIGIGLALILFGVVFLYRDRLPWIGRLPGDIYIQREGFSFYFPITTCILLSVILSLILRLFRR